MNKKESAQFFECLGEIWRDITAIEFLMRSAIAIYDQEEDKFPKPPYDKGKIYKNYPRSFSCLYFREVAEKFNKYSPNLKISEDIIKLRNVMAHGIIAEIDNSGIEQLIKFKKSDSKNVLKVEFEMPLKLEKLIECKKKLKIIRRKIIKEIKNGNFKRN